MAYDLVTRKEWSGKGALRSRKMETHGVADPIHWLSPTGKGYWDANNERYGKALSFALLCRPSNSLCGIKECGKGTMGDIAKCILGFNYSHPSPINDEWARYFEELVFSIVEIEMLWPTGPKDCGAWAQAIDEIRIFLSRLRIQEFDVCW